MLILFVLQLRKMICMIFLNLPEFPLSGDNWVLIKCETNRNTTKQKKKKNYEGGPFYLIVIQSWSSVNSVGYMYIINET